MIKKDGFYFIPKQWLGDANIISMDWDCKAMHLHLMCIAWQQDPKGYLFFDEKLIRKLLGNPEENDWETRIKSQILSCWKTKNLTINGETKLYLYQPGIIKYLESEAKAETPKKARAKRTTKTTESNLIELDNQDISGFNLETILSKKDTTTILHETTNKEEKHNIWTIGVQILRQQGDSDGKARAFIARIIKTYGEKPVAEAIAQLSLKNVPPAEIHAYLIGILNKQQEGEKKRTNRGSVAL